MTAPDSRNARVVLYLDSCTSQTPNQRIELEAAKRRMGFLRRTKILFDAKMNLVPDLAESYRDHDGALELKLRQGVRFHDGNLLTADDVKFTLERLLDDKFASPNKSKVSSIDRIEVPAGLSDDEISPLDLDDSMDGSNQS